MNSSIIPDAYDQYCEAMKAQSKSKQVQEPIPTTDQSNDTISAKAREYARSLTDDQQTQEVIITDSLGFLNYLLADYCILEKEKVLGLYREAHRLETHGMVESSRAFGEMQREWIETIFGPKFFNTDILTQNSDQ